MFVVASLYIYAYVHQLMYYILCIYLCIWFCIIIMASVGNTVPHSLPIMACWKGHCSVFSVPYPLCTRIAVLYLLYHCQTNIVIYIYIMLRKVFPSTCNLHVSKHVRNVPKPHSHTYVGRNVSQDGHTGTDTPQTLSDPGPGRSPTSRQNSPSWWEARESNSD